MVVLKRLVDEENLSELSENNIFSFLGRQYKSEIAFIVVLLGVETACRLAFSVMLQMLLSKVTSFDSGNSKKDPYIYSVFCGVLLLIGQISQNSAQN